MKPRCPTVRRGSFSSAWIAALPLLVWILGTGCGSGPSRVVAPKPASGSTIGSLYAFADPTSILVHWSTRLNARTEMPPYPEPDPPWRAPATSRLLMSAVGPDVGFRVIAERKGVGIDSTVAIRLTPDRSYWFRSATYTGFGIEIDRSQPIEVQPGGPDVVIETFGSVWPDTDDPQPLFAWSPQGDAIVYARTGDVDPYEGNLFLHRFDGTPDEPVTNFPRDGHVLRSVDWAPDSDRIAFVYSPGRTWPDVDHRIWVTNANGAEPVSLTNGYGVSDPAWGPNGTLYFARQIEESLPITQVEAAQVSDSTAHRTILSSVGYKYGLNVHPDGARIVYSGEDQSALSRSLFVLDVTTGLSRRLMSAEPWDDISPSYSRDGKTILFCSRRSGTYEVWRYDLTSGRLKQITHAHSGRIGPGFARESPDGQRLALWLRELPQNEGFVRILQMN